MIPDLLAPWRDPPSAEQLIDEAQRRSGLSDFGDTPFVRPMQLLLQACREEAELSLFGSAAIRWDTVRFLTNLLRLRDEEKRCPEILDQSIEPPLIIAGLPRSGTTFLHSLLIEDHANIVPRVWQLIYPYPTRWDQRAGCRRSPATAGRPAIEDVSDPGAAISPAAPDRGLIAAGMFGNHGTYLRQPAL